MWAYPDKKGQKIDTKKIKKLNLNIKKNTLK